MMREQAAIISLIAIGILIVVGRLVRWTARVLLLLLVAATVFVWSAPDTAGRWIVKGRGAVHRISARRGLARVL
jgi:uncharacterized membrane protein YphA (DoxX/SURF4 family)